MTFECAATGDPAPSVQWILPAKRPSRSSPQLVEVAPGRVNLVIEQVTFEDQGDYKCVASNIVGEVHENVSLVGKDLEVTVKNLFHPGRGGVGLIWPGLL